MASFTNTPSSVTVILNSVPSALSIVVLPNPVLYATVPATTWYCRIPASASVDKSPKTDAMAEKAALLGTKTVMFSSELTVSVRSAASRAPAAALRLDASAVSSMPEGMVRTELMMWMTPPLNSIS